MKIYRHAQIARTLAVCSSVVLPFTMCAGSGAAAPAKSESAPWCINGEHNYVSVVAVSPSAAFAVGVSNRSDRNRINRWDGKQWLTQRNRYSAGSGFSGVDAASVDDAWAVGSWLAKPGTGVHPLAVHWDGTSWHRTNAPDVPHSGENSFAAVSVIAANDVWAVGAYQVGQGDSISLVEHWDGASWKVLEGPDDTPQLYGVMALADNDVWAAAGDQGVDHWNGHGWTIYTPGEDIRSVSGTGSRDVWAVGGAYPHTLAQHWDGQNWTTTPTPDGSQIASKLTSVSAVSDDNVWATGGSWNTGGVYAPAQAIMEHWDGQHWTLVDVPNPGATYNILNSVSLDSAANGWAVGRFTSGSDYQRGILMFLSWDGSNWRRVRL